ncbi:lipoate--protein ligase family protein [Paenibacillus alvei]|uniref:Lipoate--protein ligase family protein n=1 Tax=Paenibacillus alvei TaxID=44250 RepID=A0ABT4H2I3_PAEAL|nr:lipoate--protein ligase family protein [Paenibacillus alvei]EJW16449.1 biotin/lipoate A/B protein ligase [Paenibacillus alvei DSM 29]MCY9542457.1 lipoate--protein ligase family protein [Paenibacillus alvei]MCY9704309.1 lipoate--protein ligase family protein [Paenibacillus alvei]MCY9738247.1 lipoate--protein ligase family protein [Paenibacillus alvei]MCY9756526.1 lipoate--protein ligase family protein [Paenibacillus alvei]
MADCTTSLTKGEGLDNILLLDRTQHLEEPDILYPFALDELLCRHTGKGGPAVCHLWRHPRGFVMGLRDSRLPHAAEAQQWLESLGYSTAVRSTGGAAVPLDLGVVNISLILPKEGLGDKCFRSDYERMYQLIKLALRNTGYTVDKGEIDGAYCPGDYDLSIGGMKFCGIAQRRQAHAFVVQAFVICEGSGKVSAELVRSFYERAALGVLQADHPVVTEDKTGSLEELASLGSNVGIGAAQVFIDAVKKVVQERQSERCLEQAASGLWLPESEQVHNVIHTLRERYGIKA